MRELNKANYIECINDITALIKYKLTIWNVMHYFKKKCTFNDNVKLLTFLLKRIVIMIIMMKKIYKKFISALINLI